MSYVHDIEPRVMERALRHLDAPEHRFWTLSSPVFGHGLSDGGTIVSSDSVLWITDDTYLQGRPLNLRAWLWVHLPDRVRHPVEHWLWLWEIRRLGRSA